MSKPAEIRNDPLAETREYCERSLKFYAHTVEPHRMYGECHDELYDWWQQCEEAGVLNTLALLPRDHQKSHCIAIWCSWQIVRDPATTIVYVSATSELAARQLEDIKTILTSDIHMALWPNLINPEEGKRAMWNLSAFSVDHPKRRAEGVRDPTVSIAGMTTVTTGWHCKIIIKDDVVVPENAYTREGRNQVEKKCSQFASILTTGGKEWVVGTRYHGNDHYSNLMKMVYDIYDDEGNLVDSKPLYATTVKVVETDGKFLWPRKAREDGTKFGFDMNELSIKKAKYTDRLQFNAQYYQDPNDPEGDKVTTNMFMYYSPSKLTYKGGKWRYLGRELCVIAACDFAYSMAAKADFTTIAVLGMDWEGNVYVLELVRFKTAQVQGYYDVLRPLHMKWRFKYCRVEATAAQVILCNELRLKFEQDGQHVKLEDFRPTKTLGAKEERIAAALKPLYKENRIYHYRGGECATLEAEITQDHPAHDDVKDVVAGGVSYDRMKRPYQREVSDDDDDDDPWGEPRKKNAGPIPVITRFGSSM